MVREAIALHGTAVRGLEALARGLMDPDPADPFRQGYTAANAYLAVLDWAELEGFAFEERVTVDLRHRLGVRVDEQGHLVP